jgi:hypothetical protein
VIGLRAGATHWRGVAAGCAALAAAGVLGWLYFTVPGAADDDWAQRERFYGAWENEWFWRDANDYESVIQSAKPDPWATMVVRSAMKRWRLWDEAPELWQNLMADRGGGGLAARDKEEWTRFMRGWDRGWDDLRSRAEKAGRVLPGVGPDMISQPEDGLLILHFADKLRTAQVGTHIRLLVDAPPLADMDAPVRVYWQTKQLSGTVPERMLLCVAREIPGAPAGLKRYAVDMDFSGEPGCLAPQAQPQRFFIRAKHTAEWKPVGAEYRAKPPQRVPQTASPGR